MTPATIEQAATDVSIFRQMASVARSWLHAQAAVRSATRRIASRIRGNLLKISTTLAAAAALASITASAYAQTVTLDYIDPISGTFTTLPAGWTSPEPLAQPLPTTAFDGSLSGSVTYTLSNGVYVLTADAFNVTGATVPQGFGSGASTFSYGNGGPDFCDGVGSCIDVQGPAGAPTGATVNLTSNEYHGSDSLLNISASGVSASYELGGTLGPCVDRFVPSQTGPTMVYNGPTIAVCTITATSSDPGTWTVASADAPEIDPGTAGSALTLLAGCVAMMRGRKRIAE
jgi:hypothetical protein